MAHAFLLVLLTVTANCRVAFAQASSAESAAKHSLLIPVTETESLIRPQKSLIHKAKSEAPLMSVNQQFQQKYLLALDKALKNDTQASLLILNALLQLPISPEQRDRVNLSIGRVQYQAGDNAAALVAYRAVRRGSPSWLESLEEIASADMRLGHPQEALATLKTLLTPLFQDRIASEPYYLVALAELRVCDYRSVFRTLELFKARFRPKVKAWELAKSDPLERAKLRETSDTIQKLNLVEAEAIQRLYIDESGKKLGGSVPRIQRESDQISFPADGDSESKEVWLDEVDSYKVAIKGCPTASEQTPIVTAQVASKNKTAH